MIGESDKYLAYIFKLWEDNTIDEAEYLRQVDVMTDYRIWITGDTEQNIKFNKGSITI